MKHIIVIGGAGYIGSACAHTLLEEGYQVTVVDDLSTGQRDKVPSGANLIVGDVCDNSFIDSVFAAQQYDAVIHFAAKKSVAESEQDPTKYFATNVGGVMSLLRAMERYAVPHIIFSSTAAVYASSDTPVREDGIIAPSSVYGLTKYLAEQIIASYARLGKIQRYSILRYFNVAGDAGLQYVEQDTQNVFPILVKTVHNNTPFSVYGNTYSTRDGTCVRDYIHLKDLVAGHLAALVSPESGIFNLGTGSGVTVFELITAFEHVSGVKLEKVITTRRAGDVASVLADSGRAATVLGWTPQYTLKEMVASALETYTPRQ